MAKTPLFHRPTFSEAVAAWKSVLAECKLPTELVWIFDENLCFEKDASRSTGYHLGFQTRFTPPPPDAERIAYDHFCQFEMPVVFYRVGSRQGKSICVLLGDPWFEGRSETDGFTRRDEWLMLFYPGESGEIDEVTDLEHWKSRILRNRPIHDLDFCMRLGAIHEILAHGRALTPYEQYALKFLDQWKNFLSQPPSS